MACPAIAVEGGRVSEDACPARERPEIPQEAAEAARRGDPEAFGLLYREHAADVARLCRRLLGAGPEAEDAASEAFLRARASLLRWDPTRPLRPWLLAVAAHHCVDLLRRRAVEGRLFAPEDLEAAGIGDGGPGPLAIVLDAEARRLLLASIDALAPRDRTPLVLRYFAGLSYEAIAEILGVTRAQVGTLLYRAKARLRARYLREEDGA